MKHNHLGLSSPTRALCYFRNLVYTTFREARHLGTKGWHAAFTEQAVRCREAARLEKDRKLFKTLYQRIRNENDLARIVAPFAEATGLNLADLPAIFGPQAKWEHTYGGKPMVASGGRPSRISPSLCGTHFKEVTRAALMVFVAK